VTHPTGSLFGLDVWRGRDGVDGRMRGHDGVVGFGAGWRGLEGMTVWLGGGYLLWMSRKKPMTPMPTKIVWPSFSSQFGLSDGFGGAGLAGFLVGWLDGLGWANIGGSVGQ
jgi:hypothetical protein